MSRTYRRTNKGQKTDWLPGLSRDDIEEDFSWRSRWYKWKPDPYAVNFLAKHPHRIKDIDDCFYHGSYLRCRAPSWWNRLMHTRPRRHIERELCKRIVKDEIDLDEVSFPLHTKPHSYYW
jgi:hypothetical protein